MSLIHLKQGIPELFRVFSSSMTTSLTLIKEGLGWLLSLPFVLINGGCSVQTQGVREIKYPAHTERDRANAGALGEIGKPSVTLATLPLLSFPLPIYSYTPTLLPLLGWFASKWLLSKNIALYAVQSLLTIETPCKQIQIIDLDIHSTAMCNKLFSTAEDTFKCCIEFLSLIFRGATFCLRTLPHAAPGVGNLDLHNWDLKGGGRNDFFFCIFWVFFFSCQAHKKTNISLNVTLWSYSTIKAKMKT